MTVGLVSGGDAAVSCLTFSYRVVTSGGRTVSSSLGWSAAARTGVWTAGLGSGSKRHQLQLGSLLLAYSTGEL